jgi:hypothetical protein
MVTMQKKTALIMIGPCTVKQIKELKNKQKNCIAACGANFLTSLKSLRLLSDISRNLPFTKYVLFVLSSSPRVLIIICADIQLPVGHPAEV